MTELSTSIEWMRWTRDVMPRLVRDRAISRGEGLMLKELGSRADRRGACFCSAATLGEGIGVTERQAERLLGGLRAKKLINTTRRGRGCLRTLQPAAVPDLLTGQLSFDDLLAGSIPEPVAQDLPAQPARTPRRPTFSTRPPTPGCREKDVKSFAAADARVEDEIAQFTSDVVDVVQPLLPQVVALLRSAPDVALVDPYVVNALLVSRPESAGYRHLEAAGDVLSAMIAGRFAHKDACRLLSRVLDDQLRPKREPRRAAAGHGGRRRSAPPVPASVQAHIDRENEGFSRLLTQMGGWPTS